MLFEEETQAMGGGDILKYVGTNQSSTDNYKYMDSSLIHQFSMITYAKYAIYILLILICLILIMRVLKIKSPFKGHGIKSELKHINAVKRRDESIIKTNKAINNITTIVEKSPFKISQNTKEYWNYNLIRLGTRIPGGSRLLRAEELHALIIALITVMIALSALLMLFISIPLGGMLMIMSVSILNTVPIMYIRVLVRNRDDEIIANFANFYLMIHHTLISNANTPLDRIMKSYDKTTTSDEMHRFVAACIHNIDTYGDYEATNHIAKDYKEIPEVGKLMRLIRQANEGGEVKAELMGFRQELLNTKKYEMDTATNKLINRARASFNILMPILIQAIISAMSIYFKDIMASTSLF